MRCGGGEASERVNEFHVYSLRAAMTPSRRRTRITGRTAWRGERSKRLGGDGDGDGGRRISRSVTPIRIIL